MGRRAAVGNLERSATVFGTDSDPRPLSVNVWVRPASYYTSWCVWENDSASGSPGVAMIVNGSGGLDFYSGGYSAAGTAALSELISLDVWSMFTATWDASDNLKLYVNGALQSTTTLSYSAPVGTPHTSYLNNLAPPGSGFNKTADFAEFAAWTSVLTGPQVASMYASAETGYRANTIGVTPSVYCEILVSASPETETVGGQTWTVNATMNASTTISSSPAHPNMSDLSSGSTPVRPWFFG